MVHKIDIFAILKYMDEGNFRIYETISQDEEMLKEFETNLPWVIKQWMTGAVKNNDHRRLIENFDSLCNIGWFEFGPELQTKLLACCGSGKSVKHKFYKVKANKSTNKILDLFRKRYPDIRQEQVSMWIRKHDTIDFEGLLDTLGIQKDERKVLTKEFEECKA